MQPTVLRAPLIYKHERISTPRDIATIPPDILPILDDIRRKYGIPEISPTDNGLVILLEHELEIDWKAVHEEILEGVKKHSRSNS